MVLAAVTVLLFPLLGVVPLLIIHSISSKGNGYFILYFKTKFGSASYRQGLRRRLSSQSGRRCAERRQTTGQSMEILGSVWVLIWPPSISDVGDKTVNKIKILSSWRLYSRREGVLNK